MIVTFTSALFDKPVRDRGDQIELDKMASRDSIETIVWDVSSSRLLSPSFSPDHFPLKISMKFACFSTHFPLKGSTRFASPSNTTSLNVILNDRGDPETEYSKLLNVPPSASKWDLKVMIERSICFLR